MYTSARRALCTFAFSLLSLLALLPDTGLATAEMRTGQETACVFDHATLRTASGKCRPRARAYPAYVVTRVQRSIYDSALTFGIPYSVLLSIAMCESSLNPRAAHSGHYGLYQFLPTTFREAANGLRHTSGVFVRTYWNPLDASYAAGYLFATGESRRWACEQRAPKHPVG